MVRLHSSTLFSVLRLALLPALLLSLLYMFSLIKTKSEFIYHQRGIIVTEEMLSHTQQSSSEPITTTVSTQEEKTAITSAEPSPNKYNLMEETYGRKWSESPANMHLFSTDCTIVITLRLPAPNNLPYQMDHPEVMDPSDGQSKVILKMLQRKTNGFFHRMRWFRREFLSNTLYMERSLGWSGLLIEADRKAYSRLLKRNRKAYTAPVCLSTKPYPMQVIYNGTVSAGSFIVGQKEWNDIKNDHSAGNVINDSGDIYKIQCFPLYSILLAVGRTHVDYFSLDVEGSEYKILRTIPWHKVYMQTLTVEWDHTPEGEPAITRLMEDNNFIKFGMFSMPYSREIVFVQDFLYGFRIF
uniref:Methyltransferase FkbM domain-containing protein n=1 Tax=Daphnia galeata TaxID=27404 RepID=A0A8J2RWA2_9CRUS|nr:unnamed protein product [Daphnia galeata]